LWKLTILSYKQRNTPVALRTPYLRVLGLEIDTDGTGRGTRNFTAEEEEEFSEMARGDGFYERFAGSIAPSIFGNEGAFARSPS
jgi:DNA replication licensing factor MCM5